MSSISVAEINRMFDISPKDFILEADLAYSKHLTEIAAAIKDTCEERPIILLSGPSGSAKTSTALRIENILDRWGYETHTISMDNYFLSNDINTMAVDENGKIDFESPYRLDIPLLQQQLDDMLNCRNVEIPIFNFVLQQRAKETVPLRRKPKELILLEGIHALNPEVTGSVENNATRLFVSVSTSVAFSDGRILSPSRLRLIRRMLRDKISRGRTPLTTYCMLESINRGEKRFILPYRDRAHFEVDTFMPYELGVYRSKLLTQLEGICAEHDEYSDLKDITDLLRETSSIKNALVSKASPVNEFVRGGIVLE